MTINIDALLSPVSRDNPCGVNLDSHAAFQSLEHASAGKAEQQFGTTIIPAEPAASPKVATLALHLLSRRQALLVMLAPTSPCT